MADIVVISRYNVIKASTRITAVDSEFFSGIHHRGSTYYRHTIRWFETRGNPCLDQTPSADLMVSVDSDRFVRSREHLRACSFSALRSTANL